MGHWILSILTVWAVAEFIKVLERWENRKK